jgi:cyclopropane-fatty-acyl-phospholipid synthase
VSVRRVTAPLRAALAQALPERPFRLELWDGSVLPPTNGAVGPTFRVRSPRALGHVLRAPGQLGLGRAYVSGEIEVDDMDAVLELLDGYAVPPLDARGKARLAASAVRAGARRARPRPSCALAGDAIAVSATGARSRTTMTSRTSSSGWCSANR